MPLYAKTRLTYIAKEATVAIANSGAVSDLYRINGAIDPWAKPGGNSPIGWDFWSSRYKEYYVKAATLRLIFWQKYNAETASRDNIAFTLQVRTGLRDSEVMAGRDWRVLERLPGVKTKFFSGTASGDNTNFQKLRFYRTRWHSNLVFTDPDSWSESTYSVTTSPANFPDPQHFWEIAFSTVTDQEGIGKYLSLHLRIDYDIMWSNPKATNYWKTGGEPGEERGDYADDTVAADDVDSPIAEDVDEDPDIGA